MVLPLTMILTGNVGQFPTIAGLFRNFTSMLREQLITTYRIFRVRRSANSVTIILHLTGNISSVGR